MCTFCAAPLTSYTQIYTALCIQFKVHTNASDMMYFFRAVLDTSYTQMYTAMSIQGTYKYIRYEHTNIQEIMYFFRAALSPRKLYTTTFARSLRCALSMRVAHTYMELSMQNTHKDISHRYMVLSSCKIHTKIQDIIYRS